jgi:hypothetical protein
MIRPTSTPEGCRILADLFGRINYELGQYEISRVTMTVMQFFVLSAARIAERWMPDRFEVHEWAIMERFSLELNERARKMLLDAIHGSGAFRHSRGAVERLGLLDASVSGLT